MLKGQPFVVEAQQVQHGGMEVVNVDAVFDGGEAEWIGRQSDFGKKSIGLQHSGHDAISQVLERPLPERRTITASNGVMVFMAAT